jgi:hypothetical protein
MWPMRCNVVLLVLLFLAAPAQAGTGCDAPRPRGPVGLADTIMVKGVCGTFALRRDGTMALVHPRAWAPPWAADALARAGADTYIVHRGGHLGLLRDARVLWRSRLAHGSDNVVVHGKAIAFTAYEQAHPNLWVARIGGAERLAGRNEDLHGWARVGGFFTQRGAELLLRDADGRLARRLAFIRGSAYDAETQSLFVVSSSDLLLRTDGHRTTTLADLASLGFGRDTWLEVLSGGLIHVNSQNRMLLLRRDGTPFASASFPRRTRSTSGATIVSSVRALPAQRGVIFVVNYPRSSTGAGTDRVLLLERGRHTPRLLYTRRSGPRGCGVSANLSLYGSRVLYWPSEGGALVVVDTLGKAPAVELWPILRRTPGFRHHGRLLRAAWASAWNS